LFFNPPPDSTGRNKLDPEYFRKKYFEAHNCPIFVGYPSKKIIIYNGKLKDLEFFRMFEPYLAFQELTMYMANTAEPRKEIPKISDEIMSEIKGFDKWSFRKPKSAKNAKRKKI
jgi:hypothetical protein